MVKRVFRGGADTRAEQQPEDLLRRATAANSEGARAKYATAGLERVDQDPGLRAMLLRQLYLSHMEGERFSEALGVARAAALLSEVPDVACQDVARALIGCGNTAAAIFELRRATRLAPASRRAFHLWSLGSLLYLNSQQELAIPAFEKAVRWGTTARPLYLAQLGLAQTAQGQGAVPLAELYRGLSEVACGQGYGQFVLGELCHHLGKPREASRYLNEFVNRVEQGRQALKVGLAAELRRAHSLLKTQIA